MMHANTLVMVEWYDQFIPPQHHMAVTTYANACEGVKMGYQIGVHYINPELFDEAAPVQRPTR